MYSGLNDQECNRTRQVTHPSPTSAVLTKVRSMSQGTHQYASVMAKKLKYIPDAKLMGLDDPVLIAWMHCELFS